MVGENGAFTASLDADSDGEEGKFYVWTEAEIDHLLGADAAFFKAAYDVSTSGNWEGATVLNRTAQADVELPLHDEARLAKCRGILLQARSGRIRPGRDDKILADWNGLTIAALSNAGVAFDNASWIELAKTVFRRVCETMSWTDADGRARLGHSLCRGRLQRSAMIDDYANMANAALALHAATGDNDYLVRAESWIDTANQLYWDDDSGGYFFTGADVSDLIMRTKSANDSAVPSGNGSMVFALARLFYLTGKQTYRMRGASTASALEVEAMKSFPHATALLNAYELLETAIQVVVVGDHGRADTATLIATLSAISTPNLVLNIIGDTAQLPDAHPARGKAQIGSAATAYVCRGPVCSPPQTTAEGLRQAVAA